jgi:hypothetical protein
MSAYVNPVQYWGDAAREQGRRRLKLRREAREAIRCRVSGRLCDEARRCKDRRDVFIVEARRVRAALIHARGEA